MQAFNWIIGLFLIAISVFYVYMNVKTLIATRKARETFMENHPGARIEKIGTNKLWLYALAAIGCLVIAGIFMFSNQEQRMLVVLTYGALTLFFISLGIEAWNDSSIYCTDDAFLNREELVRYRNISRITPGKNFMKPSFIVTHNGKEMQTSKSIALWAEARLAQWQKERKAARKQRGPKKGRKQADKEIQETKE